VEERERERERERGRGRARGLGYSRYLIRWQSGKTRNFQLSNLFSQLGELVPKKALAGRVLPELTETFGILEVLRPADCQPKRDLLYRV
jgi:hypothetical protein